MSFHAPLVLRQATSCAIFFEPSNICLGVLGVMVNCDAADIPFRSSGSSVTVLSFYFRSCGSSSEAESCSCIVEWFAWVDRQLCGNLKFRYCRFSVYQRMQIATRRSPQRLMGKTLFICQFDPEMLHLSRLVVDVGPTVTIIWVGSICRHV